jgi:ATP-dependent helicase/nuclease subunit A
MMKLVASPPPPDESRRRIIRGQGGLGAPISSDPDILLDRNLVVRAGAGSGKTRSLVDRMVALVRSGVPARRIAAITFTIKAAGELRERFAGSLRKRREDTQAHIKGLGSADPQVWETELERLKEAEHMLEHVFIGTVHAFCGRLIRERPFEAGLSPDFGHIDPGLVMEHRRQFWGQFVARAAPRWIDRFEAVALDPRDLFDFFSECANNEDVELEGLAMQPPLPDLGPACEAVVAFVEEITTRTALSPGQDSMLKSVRSLSRFMEREGSDTPARKAAILHLASRFSSASVTLNRWGSRQSDLYAYARKIKESKRAFVESVVDPALSEWREYVFYEAGQFVTEAVRQYSELRRRRGEQTFDDLLWGARRMLQNSVENRAHFAAKFTHILVDEFQDTDPVQAEILLFLTSANRDQKDPWKCVPTPGSLFIVGDDKQSIYRFRRADVAVFRRFEQVLIAEGGERVALTTNFRSDPRVCEFVNVSLQAAFSDQLGLGGQADWEDLVPYEATGACAHEEAVLKIAIPEKTHVNRIPATEAPMVAGVIARLVRDGGVELEDGRSFLLSGPIRFNDVMVLFRRATNMPRFVEALDRLEIPYSISGGKTLGKAVGLRLLLDPLDAVLKQDAVALLAFLRGPFCGVSDVSLMDFVDAGGLLRMPLRSDGLVQPDESLADGFGMINDLQERLATRPPADAIEGWVQDFGILASLAVCPGGGGLAGSLVRLLAMIRGWDTGGRSWPEVIEELHRLEDEDIDAEQLTLDALEGNAVQLMTVHQAKGLQAKVVILADPNWKNRPSNDIYIDRTGSTPTLAAQVRNWKDTLAWTPKWKARLAQDAILEEAEAVRLAYVAATRAEELLLVSFLSKASGPWDALSRRVQDLPEIVCHSELPSATHEWPDMAAIEEELELSAARRASVKEPSYREITASQGQEAETFFVQTGEGRGKDYGTLVHRLFESMVTHRDKAFDGSWIERVAARHASHTIATADRAVRTADAARSAAVLVRSTVWRDLDKADQVFAELPYTFVDAGSNSAVETVHSGIIDLAYRLGNTWHVVDYKTDPLTPEDLISKHGAQVGSYVQALRRLAGATEIEAAIWSTHNGALLPVALASVGA